MITATGREIVSAPPSVRAQAVNTGVAEFMSVEGTGPDVLLVAEASHQPPTANANPFLPLGNPALRGYCVDVLSATATPLATPVLFDGSPSYGFSLDAESVALGASILSADAFLGDQNQPLTQNNTTNDDIYCAVIQAQGEVGFMTLTWSYVDEFEGVGFISFTIRVIDLTFEGTNGYVDGEPAQACTVGWDEAIMRGGSQIQPPTLPPPEPPLRDPADDVVVAADWTLTPGSPNANLQILGDPFQREGEWCISFTASSATSGVGVGLTFWTIGNRSTQADDFIHTRSRFNFIDIFPEPPFSELRHINLARHMEPDQIAGENTVLARHIACIAQSDGNDILLPEDINFFTGNGDVATLWDLRIFNATQDKSQQDNYIADFPPGTICFEWTSQTPGEHGVSLTLDVVEQNPGEESNPGKRFVLWDSNGDGNPNADDVVTGPIFGSLVKHWNQIDDTVITRTPHPREQVVTNTTIEAPVQFNTADGTFIFQREMRLVEWVYGSHLSPSLQRMTSLLDGTIIVARIEGECGYFITDEAAFLNGLDDPNDKDDPTENGDTDGLPLKLDKLTPYQPQTINGVSYDGRFDRVSKPLGAGPGFSDIPFIWDFENLPEDAGIPFEPIGDGPDDIFVSINNDPGCDPSKVIHVVVEAYYPALTDSDAPTLAHTEYVDLKLVFVTPQKVPRLAWAGEVIEVNYGFATGASGCGIAGAVIHFVRGENQPGNFLPGSGLQAGDDDAANLHISASGDEATALLGDDCSTTARYESEQPGEVDIEVFFSCPRRGSDPTRNDPYYDPTIHTPEFLARCQLSAQYSKIAHPIFYMAIEDVEISAPSEAVVSSISDVSATVRGWFVGTNPSGRPEETKPDGRVVPANRWVLPDDWEIMAGDQDFRTGWGGVIMPVTRVTFFMENEHILNNYQARVFNGASGWFVFDGTESSININPYTEVPSVLGTDRKPRIITDDTDQAGVGTVDYFGDYNLSYEECAVNGPTGNPHCAPGDIVGRARFYAIADYPHYKGQLPPVRTSVAQTNFVWDGYKAVTIEDGDTPTTRYVVVHMRDRDGFCDAIGYNNELGIPIEFHIETDDGIFLRVAGPPTVLTDDRKGATVYSFDTINNQGEPINVLIVRAPADGDTPDECQAWVEVSNSLGGSVDVRIFFPGTPYKVPGDLRITRIECIGDGQTQIEKFTITNFSAHQVQLEGWALEGPPVPPQLYTSPFGKEHLQLYGILGPGESKTFEGGPGTQAKGWINTDDDLVFQDPPEIDYIELVWNQFVTTRASCPTEFSFGRPVYKHFPIPEELPPSGEGPIILDVVVPFTRVVSQPLSAGWNLIGGTSSSLPVKEALAGTEQKLDSVYSWNSEEHAWERYIQGAPDFVNTLKTIESGAAYWVFAKEPFTLSLPE